MLTTPYLDPDVPAVAIFNNTENFEPFLARAHDPALFPHMYDKGNRALLWLGDPKLVILGAPAPHADYLRELVGYPGTQVLAPRSPTPALCHDILNEPELLDRVLAYAGPKRQLQLIPYVSSSAFYDLAEQLRRRYHLDVRLPESPDPGNRWVRDYLDDKARFRQLAGGWLGAEALSEGYVCDDVATAADVVAWFARQGRSMVVKPSTGNGGYGQLMFDMADPDCLDDVNGTLTGNPFLSAGQVIVEERIESPGHVFPAIEVYVPSSGTPSVTHLCTEVFLHGKVTGQVVAPDIVGEPWAADLTRHALRVAHELQRMGYQGIFDLDGVVDGAGRLYLLEANTRRTAGTHAHEFACMAFGPDYASRLVVVCHNTLEAGTVSSAEQLLALLDDLLYRAGGPPEGVVITHTACLREGEFGCLIVAHSRSRADELQTELLRRIASV